MSAEPSNLLEMEIRWKPSVGTITAGGTAFGVGCGGLEGRIKELSLVCFWILAETGCIAYSEEQGKRKCEITNKRDWREKREIELGWGKGNRNLRIKEVNLRQKYPSKCAPTHCFRKRQVYRSLHAISGFHSNKLSNVCIMHEGKLCISHERESSLLFQCIVSNVSADNTFFRWYCHVY